LLSISISSSPAWNCEEWIFFSFQGSGGLLFYAKKAAAINIIMAIKVSRVKSCSIHICEIIDLQHSISWGSIVYYSFGF